MGQVDIFSIMYPNYKITKPIRLIELFAGYGSQALALKYLGVKFEYWKICEWAIKSIQAYKDVHYTNIDIEFNKDRTKEEIVEQLYKLGVSSDYNNPLTKEQLNRYKLDDLITILKNIAITKNLVNICNVKGKDLEIVDTDKYDYIMTYSFPCQDLSLAGKRAGMSDNSTRSGMLWEVERILEECNNKPQILLMENVPQVIGAENVEHFNKWQEKLESLGYKNYHQNLIATDYGIPQTRNRTFMVSILGEYSYTFPKPIPLKLKLKDMLEDNVDEKYYLSDKQLDDIANWNAYEKPLEHIDNEVSGTLTTRSGAYCAGMKLVSDCIKVPEATKKGYAEAYEGDGVYIQNIKGKRGMVQKGKMQTLKTSPDTGVVVKNNLKRKLCNELIEKSIVKENDVIKHSYTNNKLDDDRLVPNHNISPTLDTRSDCLGVVVKGNYSPSNHNASRIVDENGLAPTVMENHGTVTATQTKDLRIRKLTPKECFRLMGVKDEDYERIAKNQSNSSLYHLAGDSIVVNVLMAIFKELFKVEDIED